MSEPLNEKDVLDGSGVLLWWRRIKAYVAQYFSDHAGEIGTLDHRNLSDRDAENQHPITSIEGLAGQLERIPAPVEPITNEELEELLK